MSTYSIFTLNLAVEYLWSEKVSSLVSILKKLNPDLVCLQELFSSEANNQLQDLMHNLEYAGTEFLTMNYEKVDPPGKFGQATLWKKFLSPLGVNKELLSINSSNLEKDKLQRSFIATKHEINGRSLWIINNHFSTNYEYRKLNWLEVKKWIKASVKETESLIVCGDFNTYGLQNDGVGDVQDKIISFGLKNAWDFVNNEECITYRSSNWGLENHPDSKEAVKLREKDRSYTAKALDYFFVNEKVNVLKVATVDLVNEVSDHLGLYMEFSI